MRSVATVLACALVIGCSSEGRLTSSQVPDDGGPITPEVATVEISPLPVNVKVGKTLQLTAVARDASGAVVDGYTATWNSIDQNVATVTSSGKVTGVHPGKTKIRATIQNKATDADANIDPPSVANVTVSGGPPGSHISVGGTAQLSATTFDDAGATLTGRAVTWTSSNPGVGSVTSSGLFTAVAVGSVSISATSEGISGALPLTVDAVAPPPPPPVATVGVSLAAGSLTVGQTTQATATLRDASNNVLTGRNITWASANTAIATVSSSGVVTAVAAGTIAIRATSEGVTGTANLTVNAPPPAPVAAVAVSLAASSRTVGQTTQATATLRDANNIVLTGRTITWASANTAVATVSSSGLVTAVAAGTVAIRATSEGVTGSASLTVTNPAPAPVASVSLSPATPSILEGATQQMTATLRDASNTVLTGRTITWSSSNTTVATVSSAGLVTGVAAGSATITATSESVNGTTSVTVTAAPPPPPPTGVPDPTLLPRATGQHPAVGTYGRNISAGQTYVDPLTSVTVLKLTDAQTPAANGGMYHGYSEGGPNISQPWTGTDGQVYYTAKVSDWLVDIRYSNLATSNWRHVTYNGEIGLAFSMNPATPRIAYIISGTRVDRYNTATNRVENTGNFPWVVSAAGQYLDWLQTQMNDTWIVGMLNSNHTVVAFRPSDGLQRTITEAGANVVMDEPHLDREYPYVYLSTSSAVQNKIVNLETGAYTDPRDPNDVNEDDHAAPLRGKIVALSWTANGVVVVDYQGNVSVPVTPSPSDWGGDWHMAGQWVFNNPTDYFVVDQWKRAGSYAIYQGMIGFVNLQGDVRLIAAHDGVGTDYGGGGQPHPTLAPDGKFVMWVSNMNGSGRYDTFIARIPAR